MGCVGSLFRLALFDVFLGGVDGSSSLGCEGVKKRRSLEGKAYFYDRGNLGALPWEESAGGMRGEQGEGILILGGRRLLEPYPRNINYS